MNFKTITKLTFAACAMLNMHDAFSAANDHHPRRYSDFEMLEEREPYDEDSAANGLLKSPDISVGDLFGYMYELRNEKDELKRHKEIDIICRKCFHADIPQKHMLLAASYCKSFELVLSVAKKLKIDTSINYVMFPLTNSSILHPYLIYHVEDPLRGSYGKKMIKWYHEHEGHCDSKDSRGVTPLMAAAESFNLQAAKTLLQYIANPNAKSNKGYSPLHFALFTERRLSHNRKVINSTDDDKERVKYIYDFMLEDTNNEYEQLIHELIINGAYVNGQSNKKHTPLMACMKHISDADDMLKIAQRGKKDKHIKNTRLLKEKLIRIAQKLIICGANPYLKTEEGKTAIDMATNEWKKQLNNAPRVPLMKALILNCCYKNKINIPSYYPKLLLQLPNFERHMRNDKKVFNTNFAQQKRKK